MASEAAREVSLNGKATSLLTASGLSLTVAFTFGGILLQHPDYLDALGGGWSLVVAVMYGFALLFGLAASAIAVQALLVRDDYVGLAEEDIFNPDVLVESDRLDWLSLPANVQSSRLSAKVVTGINAGEDGQAASSLVLDRGDEEKSSELDGERKTERVKPPPPPFLKTGTAYYRRFIAAHLWLIARKHFEIHEEKAKHIKLGQKFFILFLAFLAFIGVSLATLVLLQQLGREDARQSMVIETASVHSDEGRAGLYLDAAGAASASGSPADTTELCEAPLSDR